MDNLTFAVTTANFQEKVLGADGPVLVEFTADWCPPCRMLAPLVKEIAQKYQDRLAVGIIDDDHDPEITQTYHVMGLPTLILFHKGEPVQRIIGFRPQKQLEAALEPYLEGIGDSVGG